jgi:UDP-N-acetylglucosamine 2-epimerase
LNRICTVVGARPQFVKASVVSPALAEAGISEDVVHTGQHYDAALSKIFFEEMGIPEPIVNLGAGSGTHARQTGDIMVRLEEYLVNAKPYDALLVYGDTNSTFAAALVAAKLHVLIVHVEAGLRSFNRQMPEEINRIATDRLSSLLFCPSHTAVENLANEGIVDGVVNTGDVMYDALLRFRPMALANHPISDVIPFRKGEYYLATVHRAENTNDRERLVQILTVFDKVNQPVVWPVHPRAAVFMKQYGLDLGANILPIDPCGYLAMLSLLDGASAVLTDSGGLQKEAFWSRTPCVTLRNETEWVETLECGWNVLAGNDLSIVSEALSTTPVTEPASPYGEGKAAQYIAEAVRDRLIPDRDQHE